MTPHEFASVVSLASTIPTITTAVIVVVLYGPSAVEGACMRGTRTREHWLVMGIAVGFLGGAMDNLYWFIPWTMSFYQHPNTHAWIMAGVYFNVVFRQLAGLVAAYCHGRAAVSAYQDGSRPWLILNTIVSASILLGVLFAGVLATTAR